MIQFVSRGANYGQRFFTSEDVEEAGGYTVPNPKFDDLTNPIHPLWQFNRWRGIHPKMYQRLAPVLRLASRLLLCPASLQFIHAIAAAFHRAGRDPADMPHRFAAWPRDLTPRRRAQAEQFWLNLASNPDNYSLFFGSFLSVGSEALGVTIPTSTISSSAGPGPAAVTIFEEKYLEIFPESTRGYDTIQKCKRLRAQMLFANTMVHEMMHVAGLALNPRYHHLIQLEPCWQGDKSAELGFAWEKHVYGARFYELIATHSKNLGCHGLLVNGWPHLTSADPYAFPKKGLSTYYICPMSFVQELQTDEFWVSGPINAEIPKGKAFRTYDNGYLIASD